MSGASNVGQSGVYEAGDQRNYKASEKQADAYHEGKQNSHLANDPSTSPMEELIELFEPFRTLRSNNMTEDERTIANKLAREEKREKEGEPESLETQQSKKDSTLPAKFHGNEPSKGAKVDQELEDEEAEILKKKGNFGPN